MTTETYAKRIVSGNYMAYTMASAALTLYAEEYMPRRRSRLHPRPSPTARASRGPRTALKRLDRGSDSLIGNAVRNRETDLTPPRAAARHVRRGSPPVQPGRNAAESSQGNNHNRRPIPAPEDGDDNKLPNHFYVIKESPLGLTWVHTYAWIDRVRATDHDAAMRLIEDMERAEQN